VQFQIWDFPGQIDFFDGTFDAESIFAGCGALVFVIDAQDEPHDALNKLYITVTKAHKVSSAFAFFASVRCKTKQNTMIRVCYDNTLRICDFDR
jgi:hypothetical protein